MSDRIADIAVDPIRPNVWYAAAGSGNVWKTVNAGTTWEPVFDNYGSFSIGCVAIDPSNRLTVWVGTGEIGTCRWRNMRNADSRQRRICVVVTNLIRHP